MKKMKLVSLMLVLAMVVSMLAACGGSEASTEEAASSEAVEETTDDAAAAEGTYEVEPLEIILTTTYNETETGGEIIKHFQEYLSSITNGNITLNVYWGGTVYDTAAELEAVSTGGANMAFMGHMPHIDVLNYLAFPGFAPGSTQAALDYFDTLMFEDEETSALIQGEAADNGVIYLDVIAGGANALAATFEFTDLDSLIAGSSSFGNMDAAIFEYLGFQVSAIGPGDTYEALGNGLIDATQMGFAPMVAMSWQDNAAYWALDGTYTAGNPLTANLAWWEGLSDEQRAAIEDAAAEVEEYSAGLYDDAIAADQATVEEATGNAFVELSDEDVARFWEACFEAKAESAIATAEPNGKKDGMITILKKAADITGYDWDASQYE
ncbi:MAG: TRAP transporter substrate-binding protein DctP [Eubacterium sp.]|nr:TRAP transporter substrate-binding protein DctP [Eubacterium sp.]